MKQYESWKNQSYVGTEEQDSAAYLGTPLYSDMPIEGYENPAPQLVLYRMKKADLGKVNMDALRRQYRSNKNLCLTIVNVSRILGTYHSGQGASFALQGVFQRSDICTTRRCGRQAMISPVREMRPVCTQTLSGQLASLIQASPL